MKAYALFVTDKTRDEDIMSMEAVRILKGYNCGIMFPTEVPMPFIAGILFADIQDRIECAKELEGIGIDVAYALDVCDIPDGYLKPTTLQ